MKRPSCPRSAILAGCLASCAVLATAAEPPLRICLISGSAQYKSAESLAWLEAHLEGSYAVECFRAFGEDRGRDLPGIEALDKCDVVVVFTRRMTLPAEQLARIRRFCEAGKGIVGVRTASHAFQSWLEFDRLVLGGSYSGHYGDASSMVSVAPGAGNHPVLKGVEPFTARGGLYKNPNLAEDVTLLLTAESGGGKEPVAWTRAYKGGRVFYTSLGTPDDFRDESFRRLLVNAVFWTAGGEPEPVSRSAAATDDVFAKIATYRFGRSREGLVAVAERVRDVGNDRAKGKQVASRLVVLLRSNASPDCKRFVCRQLRIIGSDESVGALAALLPDEDLSHYARYALEQMRTPAAGAALRDALGELRGKLLAGVIASLGERRDREAVRALVGLAGHRDATVATAAMIALGEIGGRDASRALGRMRKSVPAKLRPVVIEAQLRCAEGFLAEGSTREAADIYRSMLDPGDPEAVRAAGLGGMLEARQAEAVPLVIGFLKGSDRRMAATAARLAARIPGEDITRALAAELLKAEVRGLPPTVQVMLLGVLGRRGDAAAKDAVIAAVKSDVKIDGESVRVAALKALGDLGDASTVPMLTRFVRAASSSEREAARKSLDRLRGPDVDEAILAQLEKADAGVRLELIRSLSARGARDAQGALVRMAGDADDSVRRESVKALGVLGDEEAFGFLVGLLVKTEDTSTRREAEKALTSICSRAAKRSECASALVSAYSRAEVRARSALLRLLSGLGGEKALALVRSALTDREAEIRISAVRSLAEWPDPAPTEDLLRVARSSREETHRVLALRGYVRMVELGSRKSEEKLRMLGTAMQIARRPEEKKLVLKGASAVKTSEALSFVVQYLDDKALRMEAAGALALMARDGGFRKRNREELKKALEEALIFVGDARLAGEIKKYLKRIGK